MDENKREGKQRWLEESQALMLSETCALTETEARISVSTQEPRHVALGAPSRWADSGFHFTVVPFNRG